uniref:Reverse transcriptase domain-containing protein n=1 Tax=Cannabis sativa TaxID=3483 RepID=A0A803NY15_CANSA
MDDLGFNPLQPLTLTSDENTVYTLDDLSTETSHEITLLLKLCTVKHFSRLSLIKTLSQIWTSQCRFPVVVSKHFEGLFLVTFGCEGDKRRILDGQPWHFAQSLTIFAAPDSSFPITPDQLHYVPFWVQIYGIPFRCKSYELAKLIATGVGNLIQVDSTTVKDGTEPYLRVRFLLDVNKPIRCGIHIHFLKMGREFTKWLDFKYERLSDFCFYCGKLDHTKKYCHAYLQKCDESLVPPPCPYDLLLRGKEKLSEKPLPFQYPHAPAITIADVDISDSPQGGQVVNPFFQLLYGFHPSSQLSYGFGLLFKCPSELCQSLVLPCLVVVCGSRGPYLYFPDVCSRSTPAAPVFQAEVLRQDPSVKVKGLAYASGVKRPCFQPSQATVGGSLRKMSLISWNARGLGNPRAFNRISLLVKNHKPTLLFLMETRLKPNSVDRFKRALGFVNGFEVPRKYFGGGLLLLWGDDANRTPVSIPRLIPFGRNGLILILLAVISIVSLLSKAIVSLLLRLKDEIYWKQRARVRWLKAGDRNTKFFHKHASSRRKTNRIKYLKNDEGVVVNTEEGIAELVISYFSNLFASQGSDLDAAASIFESLGPGLDEPEISFLAQDFTVDEVKKVVFQLSGDKAVGLDGLNAFFYQKNWSVLGADFNKAILDCLNQGSDFSKINSTLIVLIPKKQHANALKDFKPISLCTTIYKVISKILANRLKKVLDKIISPCQSAFVSGRIIQDNILIANELMHAVKNQTVGKRGWAALKLDMAKAFDRVEWDFLRHLMFHFNFPVHFVSLVFRCLTTASISFSINGQVHGSLKPTRGLRQDDPISPYLFILCSEGLSAILQNFQNRELLRGIAISRQSPSITHLLFADDSFLFCTADHRSCETLHHALSIYSKASGQTVNFAKSFILFSPNTKAESHKWFSRAVKETLIKDVLQAIPSYAMACYRVPTKICKEIESLISKFWWSSSAESHKAMLAKQAWRIFQYPNSLLCRVLKARYFPNSSILEAVPGHRPSFSWRSILWGCDLLKQGLIWKVDILQVPISGHHCHDTLIWGPDKSGLFTVKTAYHLALQSRDIPTSSSFVSNKSFWTKIWASAAPPKIKHLIWRALSHSLPVASSLFFRHILTSPLCPVCQLHLETVEHAILGCTHARKAWKHSKFFTFYTNHKDSSFSMFLASALDVYNKSDLALFFCFIWSIWNQRNNLFHKKAGLSSYHLFDYAANYLHEYIDANARQLVLPSPALRQNRREVQLPAGQWIVYTDAALDLGHMKHSYVVVAFDIEGCSRAGFMASCFGIVPPEVAEGKAILAAIQWIQAIQLPVLTIASDCQSVVDKIYCSYCNNSVLSDVINGIRNSLLFSPNLSVL